MGKSQTRAFLPEEHCSPAPRDLLVVHLAAGIRLERGLLQAAPKPERQSAPSRQPTCPPQANPFNTGSLPG